MMRKFDIVALLSDGFGAAGGIARYNCDLVTALGMRGGHGVHVIPRFGSTGAELPEGVSQVPPRASQFRWALACLQATIARHADVVFCGHINAVPLVAALARMIGKPLWVQVHGFEAWTARGPAIRWGVEQASLVTSVSRYTRRRLLEWARIDPSIVRVLPNTFSPGFSLREPSQDLAARLGLSGRKVILTIGRVDARERYKGHDRIIRLLPRILESEPAAHYVVAGSGSDLPRLQALAAETGVRDRVTFAGQVSETELADYLAVASVFAMPSTGEGFGIVFLEAAASGLYVVGGNRDGSVDALADGEIGRAVDPDDEAALQAAIVDGLRRPVRAAPPGVSRFAFDNFATHANDLLSELVTRASTRPAPRRS